MILKVSGITNQEDASAAVDAGANAIGFNFYARSPRFIAPESAREIVTPAGVRRVGVFVNQSRERVQEIVEIARLDTAQLHGDESEDDYTLGGSAIWKAVRVGPDFHFAAHSECSAEAILLDGPAAALYGGAGRTFDWARTGREASAHLRIVIAGGPDASNVAEAVRLMRPWGVDACSRIEIAPGKKDHNKMRDYLKAAKEAMGA
jgi:phosphoribosylanthranilate isomerase